MATIDWIILSGTLLFIVAFGVWRTRGSQDVDDYVLGGNKAKWWTVGLSVMATQASAITFLSTPGQAFHDVTEVVPDHAVGGLEVDAAGPARRRCGQEEGERDGAAGRRCHRPRADPRSRTNGGTKPETLLITSAWWPVSFGRSGSRSVHGGRRVEVHQDPISGRGRCPGRPAGGSRRGPAQPVA